MDEELVVLLAALRVLAQENREDGIVSEQVRGIIRVAADGGGADGRGLLEAHTRELEHFLIAQWSHEFLGAAFAALQDVRETVEAHVIENVVNREGVDESAHVAVLGQRPSIHARELLAGSADVVGRQIRPVGQRDVHRRVHRIRAVRGRQDKLVQGERQAIVEFRGEVLEQRRVVNCNVHGQVRTVDEVGVLTNSCNDFRAGFRDGARHGTFRNLVRVGTEQRIGVKLISVFRRPVFPLGHSARHRAVRTVSSPVRN